MPDASGNYFCGEFLLRKTDILDNSLTVGDLIQVTHAVPNKFNTKEIYPSFATRIYII